MSTNRLEDWIDSSWIENYLSGSVPTPDHWLFIRDTSRKSFQVFMS